MTITIYHNPRCSKSRQTLQLILARGLDVDIVEYLKYPPGETLIETIVCKLGLSPREILRGNEPVYRELDLDNTALSERELIAAMAANPILIERPIVVNGAKAAIGRPPEAVLAIL